MNLKPLKKKVSITLDEDIIEKLKSLAEDCDWSLPQHINLIVTEYLKTQEKSEPRNFFAAAPNFNTPARRGI
ncbi:MAG: CopG family transcriptional regulator, partial [Oscillospiraceae bacterium]